MSSMIKPANPTKVCSNCGQQKPLSAFLQMAEGRGYGNICSTCRHAAIEDGASDESADQEESSTSKSRHRIDSKAKVHGEIDKRQLRKEKEEQYHQEREKNDLQRSEKWQKIIDSTQDSKKYRDRTRSFLDAKKIKPTSTTAFIVGGEQQAAKEARIDSASLAIDTSIPGKEKYKTELFNRFKHQFRIWLGNPSAPIAKSAEQAQLTPESEKESAADLAKKFWGKK